jgi:CheY-like chemotaxis protein
MASRILVVEDDEKSRRLLVDVLGWHGYDVAAAENGERAIASAHATPPHAALLDIQLPGMSGFDVLAALRGAGFDRRIPAIAVTASVMDQDRRRILAAGFDAYVGKPVNIRELLGTLEKLLEPVLP